MACALAFADAGVLEPRHLKFVAPASENSILDRFPLSGKTLATIEQVAIRQTLAQTRGNKVQAAKLLGIAASTLYEKLKKYGI